MRLIKRDQTCIVFRERETLKEPDGTTYEGWSEAAITIRGNVQPAGGKLMAEQYGERLGYMLVMYAEKSPSAIQLLQQFDETKGLGAWVYKSPAAEQPDYRVVAIRPWRHIVIELERVTP